MVEAVVSLFLAFIGLVSWLVFMKATQNHDSSRIKELEHWKEDVTEKIYDHLIEIKGITARMEEQIKALKEKK